jgi:hypothetical protein
MEMAGVGCDRYWQALTNISSPSVTGQAAKGPPGCLYPKRRSRGRHASNWVATLSKYLKKSMGQGGVLAGSARLGDTVPRGAWRPWRLTRRLPCMALAESAQRCCWAPVVWALTWLQWRRPAPSPGATVPPLPDQHSSGRPRRTQQYDAALVVGGSVGVLVLLYVARVHGGVRTTIQGASQTGVVLQGMSGSGRHILHAACGQGARPMCSTGAVCGMGVAAVWCGESRKRPVACTCA